MLRRWQAGDFLLSNFFVLTFHVYMITFSTEDSIKHDRVLLETLLKKLEVGWESGQVFTRLGFCVYGWSTIIRLIAQQIGCSVHGINKPTIDMMREGYVQELIQEAEAFLKLLD